MKKQENMKSINMSKVQEYLKVSKNWRTYSEEDMAELMQGFVDQEHKNIVNAISDDEIIMIALESGSASFTAIRIWKAIKNKLLKQ